MHKRLILAVLAISAAALVAGCLETRQEFTLNPDGSGKVVFEAVIDDMMMNIAPTEPVDQEVRGKQIARQILDSSAGVDAWSDVLISKTDDSRIRFRGTAYFKEFGKLKFQSANFQGLSFRKDDKGGMVLSLDETGGDKKDAPPPAKPSDEEIAKRIADQRAKIQQMRPILELAMAKMKMELAFRLPGTLAESTNFQKDPSGALKIVIDGAKLLQVLDQLAADDTYMREVVLAGGDVGQGGPKMNLAANEKLFGEKAPVRARVTGDLKPLFAYDSEVKAAKDNYPKMIERLGLEKSPAPTPPTTPPGGGATGGSPPSSAK
ncbi:MAG: hypothetical protein IMZ65_03950 [Planctomycetes bacterium]|nr:hypothetical protein [Planctomycetota bacterium]